MKHSTKTKNKCNLFCLRKLLTNKCLNLLENIELIENTSTQTLKFYKMDMLNFIISKKCFF